MFTAQWGDSAPLFYFAPQLQIAGGPRPHRLLSQGPAALRRLRERGLRQDSDPGRTIRERFGARWVTLPMALYPQFLQRLAYSPGAHAVYADGTYMVVDMKAGKPPA